MSRLSSPVDKGVASKQTFLLTKLCWTPHSHREILLTVKQISRFPCLPPSDAPSPQLQEKLTSRQCPKWPSKMWFPVPRLTFGLAFPLCSRHAGFPRGIPGTPRHTTASGHNRPQALLRCVAGSLTAALLLLRRPVLTKGLRGSSSRLNTSSFHLPA